MQPVYHNWQVEFDSGIPVYKQIINQICSDIASQRLQIGDKLPTIKNLKDHLGINPNTVVKAYRELELSSIINSQRGSGCYIASPPAASSLNQAEKQKKLSQLYQRLCSEAQGFGISPSELNQYIQQKAKYE